MQNSVLYCRDFVPVIKILQTFLQKSLYLIQFQLLTSFILHLHFTFKHILLHRYFSTILTKDTKHQELVS